jgi:hypothetical protein
MKRDASSPYKIGVSAIGRAIVFSPFFVTFATFGCKGTDFFQLCKKNDGKVTRKSFLESLWVILDAQKSGSRYREPSMPLRALPLFPFTAFLYFITNPLHPFAGSPQN